VAREARLDRRNRHHRRDRKNKPTTETLRHGEQPKAGKSLPLIYTDNTDQKKRTGFQPVV
jgi:hypothetical protein